MRVVQLIWPVENKLLLMKRMFSGKILCWNWSITMGFQVLEVMHWGERVVKWMYTSDE